MRKVGLISSAFAASACLHIASCTSDGIRTPAYTLHSTLSISVKEMDSWRNRVPSLSEEVKNEMLRNNFFKAYVFVLDETSMITEMALSHISDRLRQLLEKNSKTLLSVITFMFLLVTFANFHRQKDPQCMTP